MSLAPANTRASPSAERGRVAAVIPALDEEDNIGWVVTGVLRHVDVAIVVDNGSRDQTAARARAAGAQVVTQLERGYGAACLAGVAEAIAQRAELLLLLDGDGSDDPDEAPLLLGPLREGRADLVLGVRTPATTEQGAMTGTQRFGNWLAPLLMRLAFGAPYHDMPPFKAIRVDCLRALALTERTYGFTLELLLAAHRHPLRILEQVVHCRKRRSGVSKVSGSLSGSVKAGARILTTLVRLRRPSGGATF